MCPKCGQPLPPQSREGIWLPALKAQIFDFIHQHRGITAEGVAYHFGIKINTFRQHAYQINSLLAATNTRIVCDRNGNCSGNYRIFRSKHAKT